jgi:hypothetical protein
MAGWAALAWLVLGVAGLGATLLRQGAGVSDPFDGAQMLSFILTSPRQYKLSPLLGAVAGGVLVVIATGVQARVEAGAPALARLSAAFGLIAGGVFLLSGMLGVTGGEMLAQAHVRNSQAAEAAYLPTLIAADAAGAAGLRSGALPRALGCFSLVAGLLLAASIASLTLGVIGSLLALAALPWLGMVLLRQPG